MLCLALGLMVFMDVDTALAEPVTPEPAAEAPAEPGGQIDFDIPAQSLASALEVYSVAAGRQVVYNGKLALGLRSSAVRGAFTPEAALQHLLEGTGLAPRYMATDAFVLVPGVRVPRNTAPPVEVTRYYGRIQAGLKDAFCVKAGLQPGRYRVAVSVWITSSGAVSRAVLLGSTGDADLDARIDRTMRGVVVGAAPPPGFAQPVTLMVAPQPPGAAGDCAEQPSVGSGR